MLCVQQLADLQQTIKQWRHSGERIAFVPTMGNLHQGHLSLVKQAKQLADRVVVSIFVNPLQFDDSADLSAYPRTIEHDSQLLQADCDVLFLPDVDLIYPQGTSLQTKVVVPELTSLLCGQHRPGHFDGVATVVLKLFNMVQADIAVFGEKDFQQLLMIKKMVADLNVPIDIVAGKTIREASGLAMSSRNQYLSASEQQLAATLYQTLQSICRQIQCGERDFMFLSQRAITHLQSLGFEPDYLTICRESDLQAAHADDTQLRIFVAAHLGKARLIDNIPCYLA